MATWKPIDTLVNDVQNGKSSARELVERALQNIEQAEEYKSVLWTIAERSKQRANEIDARIASGDLVGRLAGVPFIAKDNFLVFGAATTAASNILRDFDPPYQSTAIERLEAEGAICVAKANLDAFAHGSSTENSDFMTTLNPHDKSRVPGGSSGGSAAAVALDLAPFALGTDTGGSIRLPASFCGVFGLKPTYGLVSRSGVIAMASSTDTIGPITRTVADAALVLECIAGPDQLDGTTIERDRKSYTELEDIPALRVGIVKEYFSDGVDSDVRKVTLNAINKLQDRGAVVEEISLPSLELSLACYYIICPAEVSSNLSRYDGQRYGFSAEGQSLEDVYRLTRSTGFGNEAKRRIMIGTYVLSSGFYDAYYQKAQLVRTKLIKEFEAAFKKYDVLVGPTSPVTAFKLGEHTKNPLEMYLIDIMTVAANLVGVPAASVPVGKANSMPVGLQIIANKSCDRQLLSIAKKIEEQL